MRAAVATGKEHSMLRIKRFVEKRHDKQVLLIMLMSFFFKGCEIKYPPYPNCDHKLKKIRRKERK